MFEPARTLSVWYHVAARFVTIDRDTPLLLPPNLRDWVPDDHLVHFILDAVDALDLRQVKVNTRGTGSEPRWIRHYLGMGLRSRWRRLSALPGAANRRAGGILSPCRRPTFLRVL